MHASILPGSAAVECRHGNHVQAVDIHATTITLFVGAENMDIAKQFGQNVRMGKWSGVAVCKSAPCDLTKPETNTTFFLYDMDQDQAQLQDISATNSAIVRQINAIMVAQFNHSHDPAMPSSGGGGGSRFKPGPHPMKAPCAKTGVFTSGRWWGGRNNPYSMVVDGASAVLKANIDGNHCCAWDTANATIRPGGKIAAVATSSRGTVVVSPTGTLSPDGCNIKWSERWAPWRLQSQSGQPEF